MSSLTFTGALPPVHCLSLMAEGGEEDADGGCHAGLFQQGLSDCVVDVTFPSFVPETGEAAGGQRFQADTEMDRKN